MEYYMSKQYPGDPRMRSKLRGQVSIKVNIVYAKYSSQTKAHPLYFTHFCMSWAEKGR